MKIRQHLPSLDRPLIVGSIGDRKTLAPLTAELAASSCDLMEVRLDSLASTKELPTTEFWDRFAAIPLLFTARCLAEGGSLDWDTTQRMDSLRSVLTYAACVDIEVASISSMRPIRSLLEENKVPWIASFHDFQGMPEPQSLLQAITQAKQAGAAIFKWAAMIRQPSDLARMAEFQSQDHGIPVASMGMGPLATVSRLLAAQCGSVLNYGFLGDQPTAPGQWHAADLRQAIAQLPAFHFTP